MAALVGEHLTADSLRGVPYEGLQGLSLQGAGYF